MLNMRRDKIKKVFISHPFSDNPEENRKKADKICKKIVNEHDDVLPISPLHLFSFLDKDEKYREDIMETCYRLIDEADEVWFIYYGKDKINGIKFGVLSPGQLKERIYTHKNNTPCKYL